ncbi:alpha/beta hydrolase family protein [Fodinibius sp.]|uniref:alpha/beta hydrolase family protein n=1 Tax=Fodinibius sp. TaxID=1872440 RepID=UPI002ACEFE87|nr:alpha/beta fold hydrolase [Fodinibius sp.]MDZ7659548.1 alpha/beta fold hydrolase [Fodinibius sp.]
MKDIEVKKIEGSVPSTENIPIYYDLYYPADSGQENLPVILFLHGFKGFKDWGAFPDGCRELSKSGFAVLAINFSLNGVGESMTEFDQLDLFARETLSQDLEDVGTVIKALKDKSITGQGVSLDVNTIGVLGHSRGGHTAVAAAAEYPEIKCLVTWSAVADYNARWSDDMINDWEEKGVTEIKNGRTGQMMPVKDVVYKDAMENADLLMAVKRVQELNIPALFVHSKGDEAVPYSEAEKLYEHCNAEDKKIELIPDSGHTFDTAHPFEDEEFPKAFANVLSITSNWFQSHLK